MAYLEQFLKSCTNEKDNNTSSLSSTKEETFADKLSCNDKDTSKYVDKILENRYYNSGYSNNNSNANSNSNSNSNSMSKNNIDRIQTYKYKKSSIKKKTKDGAPLETKIYHTPLSKKSYTINNNINNNNNNKFESRDPRFDNNHNNYNENVSGWKLRNAYKFLDDIIIRDINIIKKEIKKNESDIKKSKKKCRNYVYNKDIEYEMKSKGLQINTLKNELISLKNRKNRINEKDLEQQSKSEMRKMEIDQVRRGIKTPYHHKLQRTRFGQVKWSKNKTNNTNQQTINIQNVYFKNKYNKLKKDGKLEKYMKRKTKRINSKFRSALQKKSGRGWNNC